MASDLSQLDLLVIQIDNLYMDDNLLMIGAVGVDAAGHKHPLGVVEGATENSATVWRFRFRALAGRDGRAKQSSTAAGGRSLR
jgi:hypothetical protein